MKKSALLFFLGLLCILGLCAFFYDYLRVVVSDEFYIPEPKKTETIPNAENVKNSENPTPEAGKKKYTISSECPVGSATLLEESKLSVTVDMVSCVLTSNVFMYYGQEVKVWSARYGKIVTEDLTLPKSVKMLQKQNGDLILDPVYTTRISYDPSWYTKGWIGYDIKNEYTDPSGKYAISIKERACNACNQNNVHYKLYVNNKEVGTVWDSGMSEMSFSSDNKFFIFRDSFDLAIIDLENAKIRHVQFKKVSKTTYWGDEAIYNDIRIIMDSYTWIDSENIHISTFLSGIDKVTGKHYKISPTEIKQYNITKDKSPILVKTVLE